MGHRQLSTTQGYYRVTQQRKRKAVDLLAKFQVDRAGRPQPSRRGAAARSRAPARSGRPGGRAVRDLHRADQRQSPRPSLPVPSPVLRLHPLPQRPQLPARAARLPRPSARRPGTAPRRGPRAGGVGTQRGHPLRRGDRRGPTGSSTAARRCSADLAAAEQAEIEEAIAVLRRGRAQLDTTVPVRFLGVIGQPSPDAVPQHRPRPGPDDQPMTPDRSAADAPRPPARQRAQSRPRPRRRRRSPRPSRPSQHRRHRPPAPGSAASSSTTTPTSEPRSSSKPTQATRRQANDMASAARVSAASLQAELANSRAQNHRLNNQLRAAREPPLASRRRPARRRQPPPRHHARPNSPTANSPSATPSSNNNSSTPKKQLRRTTEELDAARAINRELMQRANRPAVHTVAPNMTTSAPNNSRRNRPGE